MYDAKVFFIEGINGSGKSTLAKKLYTDIKASNPCAKVFRRSERPNPIDISRLAMLSADRLEELIIMCSEHLSISCEYVRNVMENFSEQEGNCFVCNWLGMLDYLGINDGRIRAFCLNFELCDGKAGLDRYKEVSIKRWQRFSESYADNSYYLFEGALFQHPLSELFGYYMLSDSQIVKYMNEIATTLQGVDTIITYIRPNNISDILYAAAKERKYGDAMWINGFLKQVETCPYGRTHSLRGMDGAIEFCRERMRVEQILLDSIPIKHVVLER